MFGYAPRQLPTAHAVEAGEAGPSGVSQIPRWESDATSHSTSVNPVTVSHDRTRPLSKKLGHCLETNAESQLEDVDTAKSSPMVRKLNTHLEVDETDSPDNSTVISHLTTANSSTTFHDTTRPPSKTSGHCLETNAESQLEDVDTAKSSPMVRKLNTRNLPVHIRSYRKVHILHFVKE
jgi:hypothetical protein